jgi:hypothetical protein
MNKTSFRHLTVLKFKYFMPIPNDNQFNQDFHKDFLIHLNTTKPFKYGTIKYVKIYFFY